MRVVYEMRTGRSDEGTENVYQLVMDFHNLQHCILWWVLLEHFREICKLFYQARNIDRAPRPALIAIAHTLLRAARDFRLEFGDVRLPTDIPIAVHYIEDFLERENTDFGPDHGTDHGTDHPI